MAAADPILDALVRAGQRLTGARRIVAGLIAAREGTFTAADLVSDARARRLGIGRATVFRSIELLEALGAVERIELPSGERAYATCVPAHHHHVVCARCGRTAKIGDIGVGALARYVARRTGFRVDAHRLQLFGMCPDCQRSADRP